MIYYIKGLIVYKTPAFVVIDVGGVGYQVHISLHTYTAIEKEEQVRLLTYQHIKEDSHTLYGFSQEEERFLFMHLISVSGIGPNTARIICSSMSPGDIRSAIVAEDELAFRNVKGIGTKTAKQIILDLKNKIVKESGDTEVITGALVEKSSRKEEALQALIALGFPRPKVVPVLNKVWNEGGKEDSIENLIKNTLKQLS